MDEIRQKSLKLMATKLMTTKINIKNKKTIFLNHIDRLERLLCMEDTDLKVIAIIADVSGREIEDYEIDNHIEDKENLKKFEDLLREQMLVSICGYFEYSVKRLLNLLDQNKDAPLGRGDNVIKLISNLGIIDPSTENTLYEYNEIRNTCVHLDSVSTSVNKRLKSASKSYQGITGVKLNHYDPNKERNGIGRVQLEKTKFLNNALAFHFKIISEVLEYVIKK